MKVIKIISASFLVLMFFTFSRLIVPMKFIEPLSSNSMFIISFFLFISTIIILLKSKDKKEFYSVSLIVAISFIISGYISNHNYFQDIKFKYASETLNIFEKEYPKSNDAIVLRKYLNERDYESIKKIDHKKYTYLKDTLDITLDVERINSPELSNLFTQFKSDGYLSVYEENLVIDKINKVLIDRIRN